ncbi:hypothetical protein NHH03_23350 [Stieleria sp. TO1_6]|uniref:tetratricopeptide repeat protein n=1 Tax=Stieleria tagensis TaxID=2956795 RepID=UPI00209B21B4|nr:hypothetical protein [Stieleria tagensis]MCO8124695.1 hypothetical protein [Stieleria tagensis]
MIDFDASTITQALSNNLDFAIREYESQRFYYAAKFAQYALAQDPDEGRAWQILGRALLRRGQLQDGIEALEHASLLIPLDWETRIDLATAYGGIGRKSLSRDLLMTAATSGGLDEAQLLRIAASLEAVDEPVLAMEACRQAGLVAPDAAQVHYQMGYYASLCGYPTSVTEALIRRAVDLEPESVHYRIGLTSLLVRLDRPTEALAVVSSVIPSQLDQITCQCCLKRIATLFFDCDQPDLARQCAQRLQDVRQSTSSAADSAVHH